MRVADTEYAWYIRKKPTYRQGLGESPMTVAIQSLAESAPSVLLVNLKIGRPDNWILPNQTSVTPKLVREIITRALRAGWSPASSGKTHRFEYGLIRDRP